MAERNKLIRLALFGAPVRHSLSPRIHSMFADQLGLDIEYTAIETAPGSLSTALDSLAASDGRGCNVTLPLKTEAMELAVTCSEAVQLAGAANTLTLDNGWQADNTDGRGLVDDLHNCGQALTGHRIAILGAGGATAGVLAALLALHPAGITLFNRSLDRARALSERHADLGPVQACGLDELALAGGFDLVINATSLGHQRQVPPLQSQVFAPQALCYDMNYGAAARPLGQWCRERDIDFRDGLGMLVGQAAASFQIWTGQRPDSVPVLAALRSRS